MFFFKEINVIDNNFEECTLNIKIRVIIKHRANQLLG